MKDVTERASDLYDWGNCRDLSNALYDAQSEIRFVRNILYGCTMEWVDVITGWARVAADDAAESKLASNERPEGTSNPTADGGEKP